ncbi:carboxymuconolactone decarboxylase family protein [Salinibacterium hongtaonis]|uniref:Carboxymuconolactone decarboxylase family protein n=1 Tax=Homoserinimonas hongtaonis TaxID=2079791 RepID=A0A2U1SZX4_9MICO|nr:carboxymuconolactone decarboxylase family protein [Salinibacterium hongtaonis]AWB89717.1 carboxymuconolactone decarboxylase family protein [Salinibacterium hongtaonis]PWB97170.1 carboxymuconolactone decarboxylase family protein [Salinibacterium hongtaonis]
MSTDDREYMRNYKTASPDLLKAYGEFNGAVFADEGREIPKKYRELMAVAVAVSMQCSYCIEVHTKSAVTAGATEAEVAESVWVAAAIGTGAPFMHGRLAFKAAAPHEH